MNRRELSSTTRKAIMSMAVLAYFMGQVCAIGVAVFIAAALPRDCWDARHIAFVVPWTHFVVWATAFLIMYAVFRDSLQQQSSHTTSPTGATKTIKEVWVKEGNSQKKVL